MKTVFVVLSHTLTEAQITDLNADQIILLSDVNSELAAQCSQIDPASSLEDVQELAAKVVAEAVKAEATHFVCQGEPCLALWANLFASTESDARVALPLIEPLLDDSDMVSSLFGSKTSWCIIHENLGTKGLTCLQSTTARSAVESTDPVTGEIFKKSVFKHVQWRNMF
jgi:hypothetical protein